MFTWIGNVFIKGNDLSERLPKMLHCRIGALFLYIRIFFIYVILLQPHVVKISFIATLHSSVFQKSGSAMASGIVRKVKTNFLQQIAVSLSFPVTVADYTSTQNSNFNLMYLLSLDG